MKKAVKLDRFFLWGSAPHPAGALPRTQPKGLSPFGIPQCELTVFVGLTGTNG
jgi:hypothetical protein